MTRGTIHGSVLVLTFFSAATAPGQMVGGASNSIWSASGEYVGSKRCAVCHAMQARSYPGNSMSRAMEPIQKCEILLRNPRLTWSDGPYRYVIEKTGEKYHYTVTDGTSASEATLLYALGQGKAGQTYVFEKAGQFY